jgi:hypothetical protein
MYGVRRTTVYLPEELKARVEHAAAVNGSTEAAVIRDAIERAVPAVTRRARFGLYASGDPISDRVDELLAEGFGDP